MNKILAVEWAKFRWGVFDDSPAPNSGRDFYATQAFVEASKCSLEIKGKALLREKTGNQEPVFEFSFYKVPSLILYFFEIFISQESILLIFENKIEVNREVKNLDL